MSLSERGIEVSSLPIESLRRLLSSSRESVAAYDIPIASALWDSQNTTLTMEMVTTLKHQGLEGICFGGFTSAVLDLTAGFAGFIKAAEKGQIALVKHAEVDFFRPIPIGIPIGIAARVTEVKGENIISKASIHSGSNDKVFASVILEMKMNHGVKLSGI